MDRVRPLVLLVEPHEEHLAEERDLLTADCASTFEVAAAGSLKEASTRFDEAVAREQPVALLLIRHVSEEEALRDFLSECKARSGGTRVILFANDLHPGFAGEAKREGLVDSTVEGPWASPETSLLPMVRDALRAWDGAASASDVVQVHGDQWQARCHDVKDLLARHRVAYRWIDTEPRDGDGEAGPLEIVFPDGTKLVDPDDESLAQKLGFSTSPESGFYDLMIVGGGPAGLAAAVYASSEGLRTVIIERAVPGGQAGSSALIENYLGFPDGISGAELASRAVTQAQKFGAEILLTRSATGLRDERGVRVITLDDDTEIAGHAVLLAMGVDYRRLEAEGAERFTGSGVYYGAAAAEAARFRDRDVCLLGSGNSAAQGALLLARYVRRLTIITLDESLETTMSKYLVERISALPNVKVLTKTSVAEVRGEERMEAVVVEGESERRVIYTDALFIWIGAKPQTEWLAGSVERDEQGFVVTGHALRRKTLEGWPSGVTPAPLESSMRGVFVAGDVRHGSAKRVGSAVGEGSMAVQLVHEYLRER